MAGLPAVLGVNLSGSLKIGIPGIGGASNEVMGVYSGLLTKAQNSARSMGRGDYLRAIEYGIPAFAENILKAARMSTQGATTPYGKIMYDENGNPIKLSPSETVAQLAGFRPERTAASSQERRVEKNVLTYFAEARDTLYSKFRLAKTSEKRKSIMREIRQYNQKARVYRGAVPMITSDTLRRQLTQKPDKKMLLFERSLE